MASGDSLARFGPASSEPPSNNFATSDTRNGISIRDFDDTIDESLEFGDDMPEHYSGGGITVIVKWMATSATSGTISLDVAFKSIGDNADDVDTKAFAAANNANPTAPGTSGFVRYTTITFTDGADMDSIAAGEYFRMKVTRDADGTTSTDNMAGDMELVSITIKET